MESLFQIPFIIRVLGSLLIILIAHRFTGRLPLAIWCGILVLGFWVGQGPAKMAKITLAQSLSLNNIFLLVVVLQVIWLSGQMSGTGVMKALVAGVQARVPQRAALAILPAVIGLLPMPGGAIFSAPLVDEVDARRALMPILKTKINYWFRHVWEYWWPLYPGVLLAVDITGLSIVQFMLALFPLSLLSLVTGYFFLLRKVPEMEGKGNAIPKQKGENLGKLLMPIFIIIITFALMKIFFPQVARSNKYLPMIMGIFIAMLILQIQKPLPLSLWRKIFISQNTLSLVWIVALIRIYGAFIESTLPDGTLVMFHVKNELTTWGIPLLLMIIVVPFITGITTGLAVGFVGASFPIVMSFIAPAPPANILIATTILAYASGYMGMILSPVHVCLIVSNRHFQTSITKSIIKLIAPASMVLLGALAFYFLSMNLI